MSTFNSSPSDKSQWSAARLANSPLMRTIQTLSRIITAIFIVALVWAVYQTLANDNPFPLWAWIGGLALVAVVTGVGVALLVYRGVRQETGLFDFHPADHVTGQLQNETQRVEANGANALRAEIKMTQGTLQLMGGAADVMEAAFTYDDADWKSPEVSYAIGATGLADLHVRQRATHRPAMRQGRSDWFILLNEKMPIELEVHFGAGKADLGLSGLALRRLHVESGVGELQVDLSGEWRHSFDAFIKAGIGDTTVRLPRNAGVRVQSNVGMGSIHAPHMAWDGEAYTNVLYGRSAVTLEITVGGGMGKIELVNGD